MEYTHDEVMEATLGYFGGNELQANVWVDKYALRTKDGKYLEKTPEDMHHRLAREFARIEGNYPNGMSEEVIFDYLRDWQIVPQGSPMFGIGNNERAVSLSNCAVIAPPEDTMSSIFDTARDMANLYKRRFGVGTDLSKLRPMGSAVNNAAISSTGAWSFADLYSFVTRLIGQSGRRGALMLTMDIRHPDIEKFITMKADLTKVTGANVSVRVTDEFMFAVEADSDFELRWPVDAEDPVVTRTVRARDLFRLVAENAHAHGEPGFLLWDEIRRKLPLDAYPGFETESTNPCGELPLPPYDSCRLISMYLAKFVRKPFSSDAYFAYDDFYHAVMVAQRLSDDLVDLELEKLEAMWDQADTSDEKHVIDEFILKAREGRRTGLGTHGLADTLARLGIRYDSDQGLVIINDIYQVMVNAAYESSIQMAQERGPFPIWDREKDKGHPFFDVLDEDVYWQMLQHGRRNGSLLTNAPTGSVSILSENCSSGIEPVFMNRYQRKRKVDPNQENVTPDYVDESGDSWVTYNVYHPNVEKYMEKVGFLPGMTLPDYFVTTGEIDPLRRVEIQGTIQQYIDHSISSTVNLPKDATVEDVEAIYREAWKQGCKGVTVYRDGSRDAQVLSAGAEEPEPEPEEKSCDCKPCGPQLIHRGPVTYGEKHKAKFQNSTGSQTKSVYCYVGKDQDGYPVEVFVTDERGGKDSHAYAAALGRLISVALKYGTPPVDIVKTLKGLEGGWMAYTQNGIYQSIPDFVARRLEAEVKAYEQRVLGFLEDKDDETEDAVEGDLLECPACGEHGMIITDCPTCMLCGYTKCG